MIYLIYTIYMQMICPSCGVFQTGVVAFTRYHFVARKFCHAAVGNQKTPPKPRILKQKTPNILLCILESTVLSHLCVPLLDPVPLAPGQAFPQRPDQAHQPISRQLSRIPADQVLRVPPSQCPLASAFPPPAPTFHLPRRAMSPQRPTLPTPASAGMSPWCTRGPPCSSHTPMTPAPNPAIRPPTSRA